MNRYEMDILSILAREPYCSQRRLSDISDHSLGVVNRSIKNLIKMGYLNTTMELTDQSSAIFCKRAPRNAIILAAGFGMRMVPINMSVPKALMEVNGETLIERTIKYLHEAGIQEIYVVVGFMKEQFEYLIDEYGVELIVNRQYAQKNNLHSLRLAVEHISNSYIIPCDVWFANNPFRRHELYSWYMVSDQEDKTSQVRVNRKMELVACSGSDEGNTMIGLSYLVEEQASVVRERICRMDNDSAYYDAFWEEALYEEGRMIVQARVFPSGDAAEINTYEQLRELDENSNCLKSDALHVISKELAVSEKDIVEIEVLKKGMTNRSFVFSCHGLRYIMRIPGEGTDRLIDRQQEAVVYETIAGKKICDDPVYVNPKTGYKIARYIKDVRSCNAEDPEDLKKCMKKLRDFHEMELKVDHEVDLFCMIEFYESLWSDTPSIYRDYKKTKSNVFALKTYIDQHVEKKVLTHIDAIPDNFLFDPNAEGELSLQLTDWEYAGMQDPHVDLAMFCIYAMYDQRQVDSLIDIYFEGECSKEIRIKIYCYIAVCGLLWSNWCEYKRNLGVEFGEYSLCQYRYAKEYYKIVQSAWAIQNSEKSER